MVLSNNEIISIILTLFYAYLYSLTIRKILKDKHTVSSISFSWFALTNLWLSLSNGFSIWCLWYLTAFIMWSITVVVNERIKRKINAWETIPKISNIK